MKRIISILLILYILLIGCKVTSPMNQLINDKIKANDLGLTLVVKGKIIKEDDLIIVSKKGSYTFNNQSKQDTVYEVFFDDLIFRIYKENLEDSDTIIIHYDNRLFDNKVKKELPSETLYFVRRHFILDQGLDHIILCPIRKNRSYEN